MRRVESINNIYNNINTKLDNNFKNETKDPNNTFNSIYKEEIQKVRKRTLNKKKR